MSVFRLKIWQIDSTCIFELSWGRGQQLTAKLQFPATLTSFYQTWQQVYLNFYKSAVRARVEMSGSIAAPAIDWRARLVQAEAQLLAEFHYWLSSAELLPIRQEIAKALMQQPATHPVDLFLTCDSLELTRLPWEAWEIGTEFAATNTIRIARTPATIRAEAIQQQRRSKMRVLAILGDDSGLDFQADREAVQSLAHKAEVVFVGWQESKDPAGLKEEIRQAIADPDGWDILFFAGHSNETDLVGGELGIAPGISIMVSEIAPQLILAKERGLQFAIFNSCNGLSIAQSLIDLGLSQVAVMREPIHNRVAQEFLVRFVQAMTEYRDVHDAMLAACQHLKLERNLTYPSASLVPSLFRHPDSVLFQLEPMGWQHRLKQWLPTNREVIALALLITGSLLPSVQHGLLEQRVLTQAIYRQATGQTGTTKTPPILLVQIDDRSIQKARITDPKPMSRKYLAQLVHQLTALDATVVGIDFQLDRSHPEDPALQQALQSAVERKQTSFVFAVQESDLGDWLFASPNVANPNWSLQGDAWVPFWHIRPLPWLDATPPPFAYLLATAHRLQTESWQSAALPQPQAKLHQSQDFLSQVRTYTRQAISPTGKALLTPSMQLQPLTAFSYALRQRWLQPILDFSIPPEQVYTTTSAWQLLQQPEAVLQSRGLASLRSQIVIVMPGGYSEAGVNFEGEDNFPLPAAILYWRSQQNPSSNTRRFLGGEAHAYMAHHFLTHHFVIPIPDLWLVLVAAAIGKRLTLIGLSVQKRRWVLGLIGGTITYGAVSLQLYLSTALLLPWFLPIATVWVYVLLHWRRKHHA